MPSARPGQAKVLVTLWVAVSITETVSSEPVTWSFRPPGADAGANGTWPDGIGVVLKSATCPG